ncbi:response regulator aspartate phosphatase [Terrilactibacillus laevilacticus]|uniref:Tetratricopeptide repeat protein n=1 Tax=Terrilactibacillus laevilacticus TaxID=1380157 RepID=A0ABW5PM59_9BACI|nr:tetratricopeptide repeat protein [Terrilactibacillus laevilacticus]
MNQNIIRSTDVAHLLNTWYCHIRKDQLHEAKRVKLKVEQVMKDMEEDPSLSIYYSLLEFRHQLLLGQYEHAKTLMTEVQPFKEDMNDLLTYYFNFFSGIYAHSVKDYETALTYYKKAEELLSLIADEVELAEFHYKIGSMYYQMKQNLISISHAKTALMIYKDKGDYFKNGSYCKLLLALNYIDMQNFPEARNYFDQAEHDSLQIEDIRFQYALHYNLGLFFSEQSEIEKAIHHFLIALKYCHFSKNFQVKTLFTIVREKYKLAANDTEEWFVKGRKLAKEINDKEYQVKLDLIHHLFGQVNSGDFEVAFKEGLAYFEEQKLWVDLEEYLEWVGDYYFNLQQYEKSTHYYRKAIEINRKIIGEAI